MTDTSTSRSLRVFLCHSPADKPAVRELYQRLCADGVEAWLAEENLLPGQDWQREIPRAVRQSHAVIVCLSKGSINQAGYLHKEIKFALDVADEQPEDAIFLIPLKLEDCDLPDRLSRWQPVNLLSPAGYDRLLQALRFRADQLGGAAADTQSPADMSSASLANVSGGVNFAGDAQIGNDVVGRDKVIQATTYIEHATIIQSAPPAESKVARAPDEAPTWGGVEFVRIPAGAFLMGSRADNGLASDSEKPQHSIELTYDYWIGRYPVTNEQFARFVMAAQYPFDLAQWQTRSDHPVVKVSWFDALAYCKWLNNLVKAECPSHGLVLRLPTEAEWEKAARGEAAGAREWPWGNEFDRSKCNSDEGGKKGTTPVGAYSPQGDSSYGSADMAGNVWEWTVSLWGLDLFQPQYRYPYQPHDGREKLDAPPAVYRVVRGGAFNSRQGSVRAASRYWFDGRARNEGVGFRVVVAPRIA
jgi:formylglycine-generating enzyme required for sulfatase activity